MIIMTIICPETKCGPPGHDFVAVVSDRTSHRGLTYLLGLSPALNMSEPPYFLLSTAFEKPLLF